MNITQEQLAERASINSKYLSRIELGRENPTLDMLIKLAKALEVEILEIFDFGHLEKIDKDLKSSIDELLKSTSQNKLRQILKVVKAMTR